MRRGLRSADESMVYRLPYDVVYNEVINALSDCKFKIKKEDKESGDIKASAGISFWSWGENLEFLVSKTGEGTQVNAYSGAKAQLYDWGKSRKNIHNFYAALNKRLKTSDK